MKGAINVVFEGSIPENYDRYLGPVLEEILLQPQLKSAVSISTL
jgi:hypothetical protein